MRFGCISVLVVTFMMVGSQADAEICGGSMAMRVNKPGLALVSEQAMLNMPESLTIPAFEGVALDWPLTDDDAAVKTSEMPARVKIHSLRLDMQQGAMRMRAQFDMSLSGAVTITNAYLGMGTAQCDIKVGIKGMDVDAAMAFKTVDGALKVRLDHMKMDLKALDTFEMSGCALGDIFTPVMSFVRDNMAQLAQEQMEKLAKVKVPELVSLELAKLFALEQEFEGFKVAGRLESMSTDSEGMSMQMGADVAFVGTPSGRCATPLPLAPPACTPTVPNVLRSRSIMFGAGISQGLMNRGMHAAWQSGQLCIDSDEIDAPEIMGEMASMAMMMGQPPGTRLGFSVSLAKPPQVAMSSARGMEMLIDGLELTLRIAPPNSPMIRLVARADMTMAASPWIEPIHNSMMVEVGGMHFRKLEFVAGPPLDPEQVKQFIAKMGVPMMQARMASTPLSPSLLSGENYAVELVHAQAHDGYMTAYFNAKLSAAALDIAKDLLPPDTFTQSAPTEKVGMAMMSIKVAGRDDVSPPAKLRFQMRVNGGLWSSPRAGGRLQVPASANLQLVEVAAVDQRGNVDPTPAILPFNVDAVMPQVVLTGDIQVDDDRGTVQVRFAAADDRSPAVRARAVVLARGRPVRFVELGRGATLARVTDVPPGSYTLRVVVRDDADNVASAERSFTVGAGGCSVGGSPASGLAWMLLLAILVWRRRRQRG